MVVRSVGVKINFMRFIRDDAGATCYRVWPHCLDGRSSNIAGVKAPGTNLSGTFSKVGGNLA
jgi:Flp pilus assembly pilin Flp